MAARSVKDQVDQSVRGEGGLDRLLHVPRLGRVPVAEHVPMIVRHHRRLRAAGPDLAAGDDQRHVNTLAAIDFRRAFSAARSGECGR
jgi:hypothetical protein